MSRFDRRLKGTGLRPGQSTCKIGKETGGGSPNIGQYATMSWNGNVISRPTPTPTYNPNIGNVRQNMMPVQNSVASVPSQSSAMSLNNKTATIRVMDSERLNMDFLS